MPAPTAPGDSVTMGPFGASPRCVRHCATSASARAIPATAICPAAPRLRQSQRAHLVDHARQRALAPAHVVDEPEARLAGENKSNEPAVLGLRPNQRPFFDAGGFDNPEYRDTKRQIRVRLDTILGSDHLDSLFSSQTNAINLFAEMEKGSIVLVDTGEGRIDPRESSAFGCVFFAEVVRAIMQRNALDAADRRPAFLYVDEAATFFKGDMRYFFTAARQCNVGGIFAFHDLSQPTASGLLHPLMTNTATKLVSKRAVDDAPAFAPHMGFTPTDFRAFLSAMPPYHFACTIAGVVDRAVDISVPFGEIDSELPMSEDAHKAFLRRNRARVSEQRPSAPPPPPNEPPPRWTEQDDQALADAIAQQAVMMRRKNWKRVDELEEIIKEAKARKQASEAYYKDDDRAYRL